MDKTFDGLSMFQPEATQRSPAAAEPVAECRVKLGAVCRLQVFYRQIQGGEAGTFDLGRVAITSDQVRRPGQSFDYRRVNFGEKRENLPFGPKG